MADLALSNVPRTERSVLEQMAQTSVSSVDVAETQRAEVVVAPQQTFSFDAYLAILRTAKSMQYEDRRREESRRMQSIVATLPDVPTSSTPLSTSDLYAAANDPSIDIESKYIDLALKKFFVTPEQHDVMLTRLDARPSSRQLRQIRRDYLHTILDHMTQTIASNLPPEYTVDTCMSARWTDFFRLGASKGVVRIRTPDGNVAAQMHAHVCTDMYGTPDARTGNEPYLLCGNVALTVHDPLVAPSSLQSLDHLKTFAHALRRYGRVDTAELKFSVTQDYSLNEVQSSYDNITL